MYYPTTTGPVLTRPLLQVPRMMQKHTDTRVPSGMPAASALLQRQPMGRATHGGPTSHTHSHTPYTPCQRTALRSSSGHSCQQPWITILSTLAYQAPPPASTSTRTEHQHHCQAPPPGTTSLSYHIRPAPHHQPTSASTCRARWQQSPPRAAPAASPRAPQGRAQARPGWAPPTQTASACTACPRS